MLTASSTEKTFTTAGKAWLKTVIAHPLLTDVSKTVAASLYLRFNFEHYERTGDLKAWPSWQTLAEDCALSRAAVAEGLGQLEHTRLLDADRGRYDRAAQRRAGNEYFARFPVQGPNPGPSPRSRIQTGTSSPLTFGKSLYNQDCVVTVDSGNNGNTFYGSEETRSTDAPRPEVARSGLPMGPSARSEVQPRKLTGDLEVSLKRVAGINGGGRA